MEWYVGNGVVGFSEWSKMFLPFRCFLTEQENLLKAGVWTVVCEA